VCISSSEELSTKQKRNLKIKEILLKEKQSHSLSSQLDSSHLTPSPFHHPATYYSWTFILFIFLFSL